MYCSTIWRPHLIKDITMIEQLQRRATKFILNDYQYSYFDRLVKLQLFPLMYTFELADIMFAIKALKSPSDSFDITNYVSFSYGSTRSSKNGKLRHIRSLDSKSKHFYFNRFPRLWNALLPIDSSLPVAHNKVVVKNFMWSHFMSNFNPDIPCSFHFLCPCSKCTSTPSNYFWPSGKACWTISTHLCY